MAKKNQSVCLPSEADKKRVLHDSVWYEVLFTFGVPAHDPTDYCQWEAINFTRMGHARVLYTFLETPLVKRYQDDVLAEDYGFPAEPIDLAEADRLRLNKDLFHLTYSRLRHTPASKSWPDTVIANLQKPCIKFMTFISTQAHFFDAEAECERWKALLDNLRSRRELQIYAIIGSDKIAKYYLSVGAPLPQGKAILTRLQVSELQQKGTPNVEHTGDENH